jgi:hypothetical protein
MNPPDRDFWTFVWVVVAALAGVIAAFAAYFDLRITLKTLARRSAPSIRRRTISGWSGTS